MAENVCEAMVHAERTLSFVLCDMEDENQKIPEATPIGAVKMEKDKIVTMILCDTDKFRDESDCTPIEKTVTVPAYLVKFAEKNGLNLSGALGTVLRHIYGLNKEDIFPDIIRELNDDFNEDWDEDEEDWDDEDEEECEDEENLQSFFDFVFDGTVICNVTLKTPTNVYAATIICFDDKGIDVDRLKLVFDDAVNTLDFSTCDAYEDALNYIRNCLESDYGCETAVVCSDFVCLYAAEDKPAKDNA